MKVGILTFFMNPNYGAMLQAYALCSALQARGHNVEFIDYPFGNTVCLPLRRCFWTRHRSVLQTRLQKWIDFKIVSFALELPRSKRINNDAELEEIASGYDAIVVGSDQVWNPIGVARQVPEVVFLGFAPEKCRLIAYAPSVCADVWPEDCNRQQVARLLTRFAAISVRDGSGAIRSLMGKCPVTIVDPTLLHDCDFYRRIDGLSKQANQHYIFRFVISDWSDGVQEDIAVKRMGKELGLSKIVSGRKAPPWWAMLIGLALRMPISAKVSVPEWLSLIANADLVITNSFHCVVFSIVFHRPFVCVAISGIYSGMNERLKTLLYEVGLENRIVGNGIRTDFEKLARSEIDWTIVDRRLEILKDKAQEFLSKAGL